MASPREVDEYSRYESAVHAYLGELARRLTQADVELEPLHHLRSSLGTRLRPRSAPLRNRFRYRLADALLPPGLKVGKVVDRAAREAGEDYPQSAATMIGLQRLLQLRDAVMTVERDRIPGDFIETGVWRGGASLFMRCALEALGGGGSHRCSCGFLRGAASAGICRPCGRHPRFVRTELPRGITR